MYSTSVTEQGLKLFSLHIQSSSFLPFKHAGDCESDLYKYDDFYYISALKYASKNVNSFEHPAMVLKANN